MTSVFGIHLGQDAGGRDRVTVMIAAFEGWNDAGEAASDALNRLDERWSATRVGALDSDAYYDFQFTRPMVVRSGGERRIQWPTTWLTRASVPNSNLDVVLLHGVEPSYRWRAYTADVMAHAADLGVDHLILLGALLADVPHTRPIPVSISTDDAGLQEGLNTDPSTYEGPTGILGVLAEVAELAGIPAVSLWAAVPHYVAQAPSPKAQLALLNRLEELLHVPLVGDADLREDAEAWERGVDELATEDPEIQAYVHQLEEAKDTAELPEASGESIAREFERYLKRRGKER
ncbi:carboxylate--amine ligase [Tersicoccus phoenicis]|uniref:Carboxylate--amine ligase n=1 Tax=Tersicoccus phoenicis TaxID=554083 RepID=A0A1R1LFR2_9MICC|nr:PAC2 family protein [Tersicoccus phoenicis]OMH26370.1 carboxylate--amine ligase [Tersicoccus phoenicis]